MSLSSLPRPSLEPAPAAPPVLYEVPRPVPQPPAPDDPPPVQLLTPDGERVEHPDHPLALTDAEYRAFYRDLVLLRRFDDEATALQRQGELGLWAPLRGQEAAQIGSGRALQPADMAFPTYREHGVALCRGVDPVQILGLFRGVTLGGWDPSAHSLALYTIVVGAQTLHAVGYAMALQQEAAARAPGDPPTDPSSGPAVLAFFGDGASSQGDVNESLVWAASYAAPVVFFCQNNRWAISTPVRRQMRASLARRAAGFGMPGVQVDGNDVLATYAVTRDALDAARRGEGPRLIEALTYRMGAHTTSDDPTRYRAPDEVEGWAAADPLLRLRRFVERERIGDAAFFDDTDAEADDLAVRVRTGCREMPDPADVDMFRNVYVEEPAPLREQRLDYEAYAAGFADEQFEDER